jgi:hypothetical protein
MRQVMEKEIIESVVNINCGVCGQKFRMGEEVRQTITGKLGWIKDVDDDGLLEWRLAIVHGEIADVHVKCIPS